ncbi:hypothetical protein [Natranaerofaba carboxydovora]|uniref:hypothetical protein n=1 Tax=Natranaerofaba carboxydovora TaxID=2742683 RepID=UPI001F13DC7D|nr:hypothetical protein [Natranaerofaba carboxydovora]UMZ75456.1 hypothetical protein ACONDI_03084 [Natranaerofaba carboxydovora]
MLEHVISEYKIMKAFMNLFNPITVRLWGANINRQTLSNIKKAGFKIKEDKNLTLDVLKFIVAENT